ncbi:Uncharacterised protein [Neisseria meningitidis]|nr:Uncharacterised protein [Neisseria meningitidis]
MDVLFGKTRHAAVVYGGIDEDFLRVAADHIAQHAQTQGQILIKQGFRRPDFRLFLDVFPHFGQVVDVGLELFVGGVFGVGADDVAPAGIFRQELVEAFAQAAAFGIVFDALGHADVVFLRKMDEETPRQRDLGGKPRAFGVDRVFDDLHQNRLPFKQHMFDALGFFGVAALFEDIDDV